MSSKATVVIEAQNGKPEQRIPIEDISLAELAAVFYRSKNHGEKSYIIYHPTEESSDESAATIT